MTHTGHLWVIDMRHTRNLPKPERFETKNVLWLMILFDFTIVENHLLILTRHRILILYTSDTRSTFVQGFTDISVRSDRLCGPWIPAFDRLTDDSGGVSSWWWSLYCKVFTASYGIWTNRVDAPHFTTQLIWQLIFDWINLTANEWSF